MAKRKLAEFGVVVYNNDGVIETAFRQAKKVPKAYANFVTTLEIACLCEIHKIMNKVGKDGETDKSAN